MDQEQISSKCADWCKIQEATSQTPHRQQLTQNYVGGDVVSIHHN